MSILKMGEWFCIGLLALEGIVAFTVVHLEKRRKAKTSKRAAEPNETLRS